MLTQEVLTVERVCRHCGDLEVHSYDKKVPRFLNRLLGMKAEDQALLSALFPTQNFLKVLKGLEGPGEVQAQRWGRATGYLQGMHE